MSEPPGPVPPRPDSWTDPQPGLPSGDPAEPHPAYRWEPYEPQPPSRRMAGWALGLAIVPCCGITTLVGLALGIAVLVQARDGRERGRPMALAAVIIASVWLVIGAVGVAVGALEGLTSDAERDSSGRVTEGGTMPVTELRVGDCFDRPGLEEETDGEATSDAEEVEVVPCSDHHGYEVYHEFEIDLPAWPGEERIAALAGRGCLREFAGFVGIPYGRSVLEPYVLYPQERSWTLLDDREVTCLLGEPGRKSAGTLADSGR